LRESHYNHGFVDATIGEQMASDVCFRLQSSRSVAAAEGFKQVLRRPVEIAVVRRHSKNLKLASE
jgi:hypothetical protein